MGLGVAGLRAGETEAVRVVWPVIGPHETAWDGSHESGLPVRAEGERRLRIDSPLRSSLWALCTSRWRAVDTRPLHVCGVSTECASRPTVRVAGRHDAQTLCGGAVEGHGGQVDHRALEKALKWLAMGLRS